jgi:hypothetical protein
MQSDDIIKRLQEELQQARRTIVGLAPPQFHAVLRGKVDAYKGWDFEEGIADAVIEMTEPPESGRIACPLCGSQGSGHQTARRQTDPRMGFSGRFSPAP